MARFILKLVLTALVFTSILPLIPGISFNGGFLTGILLAIIFGIMLWLVAMVGMDWDWKISGEGLRSRGDGENPSA